MKVLGIETSCDETAICLIQAEGDLEHGNIRFKTLGNALYSQIETHRPYGGVFPNLAKREHAKNLVPMLVSTLEQAKMLVPADRPAVTKEMLDELKIVLEREEGLFAQLVMFFAQYQKPAIDVIAVTIGPGLEPALWVGVNFAKALAIAWDVRIVPVNHMEGHIVVSAVEGNALPHTVLPALALLISGGHTELVRMPEWFHYQKIGQTRDDAVGEAFDKVARLLGLPYPGGPEISRLAKEARAKNIAAPFTLPRSMLQSGDLDFSFSGLKTAVRREVENRSTLTDDEKCGIAREFEGAVADIFSAKVATAIDAVNAYTLIIGGGVAANTYIKQHLGTMLEKDFPTVAVRVCPPERATDNALMIALAGYLRALRGDFAKPEELYADGNLSLA
ncbi:tRNA (adenosine(37)-N6)-threonylcarbamoyltransferase complex transferase subunit TsaD [Candidatus Kaiserbacteria bacterium]|nr:tRNA (adenosine(37)-N6)-threonylcarbamoyltransferase complex transferase subunit TsaD [Candidatus Kaiserbacteria bacterium]